MTDDFDAFYRASYPRLLRQLFAMAGGDLAEAEDVLQEAFTRASVRWDQIRRYEVPEAWVRRVAVNELVSVIRRSRRRLAATLRAVWSPQADGLSHEWLDVAAALRSLPMEQRRVVVLHHLAGLKVGEIAAELRIPSGTVKSRLARGRRTLADRLRIEDREGTTVNG
jgi:RNA polymerase sigma-70 factor (sigma-E family)